MSFDDQVCWAFDCLPSRLWEILWSVTYVDVKYRIRTSVGSKTAELMTNYEGTLLAVAAFLGGGDDDNKSSHSPKRQKQKVVQIQSFAELQQVFSGHMGR